jgi:hypothetical protein
MPARVRVTANFEANLDSIHDFLLAYALASRHDRITSVAP